MSAVQFRRASDLAHGCARWILVVECWSPLESLGPSNVGFEASLSRRDENFRFGRGEWPTAALILGAPWLPLELGVANELVDCYPLSYATFIPMKQMVARCIKKIRLDVAMNVGVQCS